LVAVGLIGIVFMQVSLLRLNAGIGRSIQEAQGLERENAQLRDSVSRLGSGDRIQEVASSRGLVMPPSGTFHYLSAGRPGDAARALRMMKPPINPISDDFADLGTTKASVGAATQAATPTQAPSATPPATTQSTPATTQSTPATTAAGGTATPTQSQTPPAAATQGTTAAPPTQPAQTASPTTQQAASAQPATTTGQ
jgi:cell division protein FtsL